MDTEILYSLKQAREKSGLTQKEVEESLSMRNLMMRDYEVGRLKVPVSAALKLSKLYKVSMDELVGNQSFERQIHHSKILVNFNSLFLGNGFSVMFLDPILRAFLEDYDEKYFNYSLFELLTQKSSNKQKKDAVIEISKFLFSLASADGKVSSEETECIRYLLTVFKIPNKYKDLSIMVNEEYSPSSVPKSLEGIEIRHFVIWLLFFFAHADESLSHQEITYIEKCAECLKVNKSNFLYIKKKFVKGDA